MITPVGVEADAGRDQPASALATFREDFYACLSARADAQFDLTDALLCAEGPVSTLVGLSLVPEHRRGHGALYDALGAGRIDVERLRDRLAGLRLPRLGGVITLAVDVSGWLRPDAATSPERCFCHVHGHGRGGDQRVPGWPYQFIVALEGGATSWTAVLDVARLGPGDDATVVTARQLREVHARLVAAGQWRVGDPDVVVAMVPREREVPPSGYDVTRLAWVLGDLPLCLVARIRADRVMLAPAPARSVGTVGRPRRHGPVMALADPPSWPAPATATAAPSDRYGAVRVTSWDRMHPRLASRGPWAGHDGPLPIIEGTLVRVAVDHLPGRAPAAATPMWLGAPPACGGGTSQPVSDADTVTRAWSAYLRRFDEEHTFRFFKQTLGWTAPHLRDPGAADRWTWLVIAAYTQLRLAREVTGDLRRPWEKPLPAHLLTPARVRRGFRYLRAKTPCPASAPKHTRPGPGRPPGSRTRTRAPLHDVGKKINKADRTPADTTTQG